MYPHGDLGDSSLRRQQDAGRKDGGGISGGRQTRTKERFQGDLLVVLKDNRGKAVPNSLNGLIQYTDRKGIVAILAIDQLDFPALERAVGWDT